MLGIKMQSQVGHAEYRCKCGSKHFMTRSLKPHSFIVFVI